MERIEQSLEVRWRHRIFFTDHAFAPANLLLREVLSEGAVPRARVLFVVDESLHRARPDLVPALVEYFQAHASALELVREPLVIEGGERVKNSYFHVTEIHSAIDAHHLDRHSTVVAVGGGALLDMAGLAAATAHRGLRHVRLPSTTLSQADSGVGVKNAINAFGKKNFIGTFAPPFAVINDFQLLRTLPPRELRCGYAEAVKVACIRDRDFFAELERDAPALREFEPGALRRIIYRCADLHVRHIATSGDPFESGSARPLDFGHWAAHKLEQLSEYRIRHGEAVAIGIALDTLYSRQPGGLSAADAERVLRLLESLGFDLFAPELLLVDEAQQWLLLRGLREFQEHLGGRLTVTLLRAIGQGAEVHEMHPAAIVAALRELQARHATRARQVIPLVSAPARPS
jgi:3-dehydroquinate synthase